MEASMLKKLALVSAVSMFAMGTALAQSPSTSTSTEMKSGGAQFIAAQKPDQLLGSKFKGTDVLGPDDQKVGDVSDVLFEKNGAKIEAYIVSVGGFLGIGSKDVALAPSAFQIVPGDPNSATNSDPKLKISMTKDQLKEAPNFEPYKEPNRATTGTGGAPRPSGSSGGMNR
jgi:PRC-barrel domain protein